jgi:hypothetical protein
MAAELLSFFRPAATKSGDWSTQEIAEFYRVEAALVQAGIKVSVDRGVSDEGDPWFVFCRENDGEVIVHFARISGTYLIAAESIGAPISGPDFRRALADFVSTNPTLIALRSPRGAKLMLHPASLLAAVVATALYYMSGTEAVASSLDPTAVDAKHFSHNAAQTSGEVGSHSPRKWSDWQVAAVVGAIIALGASENNDPTSDTSSSLASTILDTTHDHIVLPHSVVADALPIQDIDVTGWTVGTLDPGDGHSLFDSFILSGGGQAVSQQYQINPADVATAKAPTIAMVQDPAGDHWWSALIHGGGNDPQHFVWMDPSLSSGGFVEKAPEQLALVFSGPSGQGLSGPSSTSDPNHSIAAAGSSSPDHPLATSDAQAILYVSSELIAANKSVSLVNLNGTLSVQDVINHGVADVFGAALFFPAIGPDGHSDGPGGALLAVSGSPSPAVDFAGSAPPPSLGSAHGLSYEAFNSAANELLDAFVRQNNFEVLTSNNNVVLFDTNAADFSSPDLIHRTWAMFDGSTISIVGIVPHNLAMLA